MIFVSIEISLSMSLVLLMLLILERFSLRYFSYFLQLIIFLSFGGLSVVMESEIDRIIGF